MSRLLLLSELHPELDAFVAGAGLVGVLPDAGDAIGEPQIAEQARAHLRRAGAHLIDVDLDGDLAAQLAAVEVLVVTGGDPAALDVRLRRTGGGPLIAEAVRTGALRYAGLSAGSMVAGPSLAPHLDVDLEDLPPGGSLQALGLTDVHLLVHHGRRGRDGLHARALRRHGAHALVVPIADADGLRVRDGVPELFGPQRGDRLRSVLPQDRDALTVLLPDASPDRPGTIVATRDGGVRGAVDLREAGTVGALPAAVGVAERLRAFAAATE